MPDASRETVLRRPSCRAGERGDTIFRKIDRDKIVDKENALYRRGFCPLEAFDFFQLGMGAVEVKVGLTGTAPNPALQPR